MAASETNSSGEHSCEMGGLSRGEKFSFTSVSADLKFCENLV